MVIAGNVQSSGVQWGTVGEWVSGIATLLAVIVAIWVPWWLWRRDHKLADSADERRRSSTVTTWLEKKRDPDVPPAFRGPMAWFVTVTNTGEDVIHRWKVEILTRDVEGKVAWQSLGRDAQDGALTPGMSKTFRVSMSDVEAYGVPAVEYRDALDVRWRRQGHAVTREAEADAMRKESEDGLKGDGDT